MATPIESEVRVEPGEIRVSTSAARQIGRLLANEENTDQALRVSVSGGGCSGFQYGFAFDSDVADDDIIIEAGDVNVVIDSVSAEYLAGSEIHFSDDLIGAAFTVRNPNAVASCGCGTSFSLV
ncbi:MAG: iron-sulfur cluster insertion protein ErpA [Alphaproteobacteria bacterium]|jgi:iron-sulfur cluster insertion protein|nr:iron-sulfur cluster insertion protein ErpA [Alphaproteobacteria bacterium]